jgi:hypothetical protein
MVDTCLRIRVVVPVVFCQMFDQQSSPSSTLGAPLLESNVKAISDEEKAPPLQVSFSHNTQHTTHNTFAQQVN